jgi:hypothetical protein
MLQEAPTAGVWGVAARGTGFGEDVAQGTPTLSGMLQMRVPEVLQMRGEYLCPRCSKKGIFPVVFSVPF